jgi:tRNA(Ile)-lysidine synthase
MSVQDFPATSPAPLQDGQRLLVAVSGGMDSMVLLALLHRGAKDHYWRLTVAHFNHQLRGASGDADEQLVRKTARQLKLPIVVGRGDVRKFAVKSGLSLEMAGRKLRHDFLAKAAVRLKIPTIALAHHADDQVELFFLRLLRGTSVEGLAGMKTCNPSPRDARIQLVRPLLNYSKAALRIFAEENKIEFSEDASNASLDIQRNRIRHELVPLLKKHYQPALEPTILRLMDIAGAEAEFVAETVKSLCPSDFESLPIAAQRRLIHQQLSKLKLSPDFDLIERLRRLSDQPFAIDPETTIWRDSSGIVRFRPSDRSAFSVQKKTLSLANPNTVNFAGVEISWHISPKPATPHPNTEYFDADKVGEKICLRRWQPGDRFQPIGTSSARKLQDLFTNLRVPRSQRHERVLAATRQGDIFWVEGLRMAENYKLDKQTVRKLQWQWRRKTPSEVLVADSLA